MSLKSSDVVTEDSVNAMVEQQTKGAYRFRLAFREHDGSQSGNSTRFPTTEVDFEGAMAEVPEGSDYPRAEKTYGDVKAVYTKYGFEYAITDEAVDDGMIDVELDNMEDAIEEEQRRLDSIAFNVLSNNFNQNLGAQGDNAGDALTFDEVVDARAALKGEQYNPDLMIVDPLGAADILKDNAFKLRDTPMGDRVVQQGFVGNVAGMDIYESNAGNLSGHEAFLVDTAKYGYESSKDSQEGVKSYREESNDQTVYKVSDRVDWVSTNAEAAVLLQG